MFTKPLNGRSYATGLAIRGGAAFGLFIVGFFLLAFWIGPCSGGNCGGAFIGVFYVAAAAFAIFLLSSLGISVRRARDAGWHPGIGLIPVFIPLLLLPLPFVEQLRPLSSVFISLPVPASLLSWLTIAGLLSQVPTYRNSRWRRASNRPPEI